MSEPNVSKGKVLPFLVRNADDTAWEILGGVKVRSYNIDAPVEDTTSQSTPGDYAESEYTGYKQVTFNVSGVADKRTNYTDPATGLSVVGSVRLLEIVTSTNPCAKFKLLNLETSGFCEGEFNVTSYSKSGDTPGLLSWEGTLQNKSNVIFVGDV